MTPDSHLVILTMFPSRFPLSLQSNFQYQQYQHLCYKLLYGLNPTQRYPIHPPVPLLAPHTALHRVAEVAQLRHWCSPKALGFCCCRQKPVNQLLPPWCFIHHHCLRRHQCDHHRSHCDLMQAAIQCAWMHPGVAFR